MKRRFLQFSLRALLVAVTIAAISSAILRWHHNRLDVLADSFQDLVHQRRYGEAEEVAARARRLYPNELVAVHMENTSKLLRSWEERANEPQWDGGADIQFWPPGPEFTLNPRLAAEKVAKAQQ